MPTTVQPTKTTRLRPSRFAKSLTDKLTEDRTYPFYGNLRGLALLASLKGNLSFRGLNIVLKKLEDKYREINDLSRS